MPGSAKYGEILREDEVRRRARQIATQESSVIRVPSAKSIQRAQKVANRIRLYQSASDKEFLVKELGEIDVFMFISEIVAAMLESMSSTKQRDVLGLTEICAVLSATYPSFKAEFLSGLEVMAKSLFQTLSSASISVKEMGVLVPKLKVLCRHVAELQLCEICTTLPLLDQTLLVLLTAPGFQKYSKSVLCGNSTATLVMSSGDATPKGGLGDSCYTWPDFTHLSILDTLLRKTGYQLFNLKLGCLTENDQDSELADSIQVVLPQNWRTTFADRLRHFVVDKAACLFLASHEALLEGESAVQSQKIQVGTVDSETEHKLALAQNLAERVSSQIAYLVSLFGFAPFSINSLITELINAGTDNAAGDSSIAASPSESGGGGEGHRQKGKQPPHEVVPHLIPMDCTAIQWASLFPLSMSKYANTSVTRLSRARTSKSAGATSGQNSEILSREALEAEVKWTDNTERAFYELMPDLNTCIPAALLSKKPTTTGESITEDNTPIFAEETGDTVEVGDTGTTTTAEPPKKTVSPSLIDEEEHPTSSALVGSATSQLPTTTSSAAFSSTSPMDLYLERFSICLETQCGSIDTFSMNAIDTLSKEFFLQQLNTKNNKKKLCKFLLNFKRTDLHALPAMARFLATVNPFCRDLSNGVVQSTLAEMEKLRAEKSPFKVESKIRVCRLLGELTKVSLVAPGTIFDLLNELLEDFQSHDILMICHLLDTCGLFLAGTRGAEMRLSNIVERMNRIKNTKTVSTSFDLFLEDVIVLVTRGIKRVRGEVTSLDWKRGAFVEDPMVKRYIRHLVFSETAINWDPESEASQSYLMKQYRRLDWNHNETVEWLTDAFLNLHDACGVEGGVKVAACLTGIAKFQPFFVVSFVDCFLEQLSQDLDSPYSSKQRRVWQMYLLRALFQYRIVDSSVVFDYVYYFMGFGSASSYRSAHFLTQMELIYKLMTANKPKTQQMSLIDFLENACNTPSTATAMPLQWSSQDVIAPVVGMLPPRKTTNQTTSNFELNSQLALFLFTNFLRDPKQNVVDVSNWFRLRLICVLLKGALGVMSVRQAMPRLHRCLAFVRYYICWLISLSGGQLPMDILHLMNETLAEVPKGQKYLNFDLLCASNDLATLIGEEIATLKQILQRKYSSSAWIKRCPILSGSAGSGGDFQRSEQVLGQLGELGSGADYGEDGNVADMTADDEGDGSGIDEPPEGTSSQGEEEDPSADDRNEYHHTMSEADLQFEAELKSIIEESLNTLRAARSEAKEFHHIPHHLVKSLKRDLKGDSSLVISDSKRQAVTPPHGNQQQHSSSEDEDASLQVEFALVTKKSNSKLSVKKLSTPFSSRLGQSLTKVNLAEDAAQENDRKMMKEFVMAHLDRQINEEFMGAVEEIQHSGDAERISNLRRQAAALQNADTKRRQKNPQAPLKGQKGTGGRVPPYWSGAKSNQKWNYDRQYNRDLRRQAFDGDDDDCM